MPIEFDIKLTSEDMYRFNMYQTYTGFHGWFSIFFSIVLFVLAAVKYGEMALSYTVMYVVFGVIFLFYMPLTLKIRSKQAINASEVLKNTLHYTVDEAGFTVSQGEESATLPWEQIYKMTATKSNVLVYSNRTNAYVIPRSQLGDKFDPLKTFAKEKLPAYRVKIK